jgi:hypothetical protein
MADLKNVLDKLKKSGLKLSQQPKDRFSNPTGSGYRDMLLNIEFPNGVIGELQLHVKPMLKAKNEGHHHYEVERTLVPKGPENWTPDERETVLAAQEAQKSIYGKAWRSAFAGGRPAMDEAPMSDEGDYDYINYDDAIFRRPKNYPSWAVTDIYLDGDWLPYEGDRLQAGAYGDLTADPAQTDA